MVRIHTCCFCGGEAGSYGNNPEPALVREGVVCCDSCNFTVVIPARLKLYMEQDKKEEQKEKEEKKG